MQKLHFCHWNFLGKLGVWTLTVADQTLIVGANWGLWTLTVSGSNPDCRGKLGVWTLTVADQTLIVGAH